MLHTIWKGASLRSWVALGMAIAVLPLAASAVAGYVMLNRGVIASFQDVAARQRDQIDPTQRLRLLIWDAVPPLDEFMDEGDPRQPREYRALREQIETAFAGLHGRLQSDPELQTLVERARDDWTAADRLANEALSVRRAPGDPHGAELMDSFNGLTVSAVDKLGAVYADLEATLRADHDSALLFFERSEWLAAIGAVVSVLAILLGVFIVGRIMSGSVERLVDGAQRFAAGDRDHRIEIRVPPELNQVAQEFNRMIGRIHESEDALADLAHRDSLTRLLNRRAFDDALVEVFARQKRLGERFALLMLDLDYFKRVNDTYGHAVGDDVLREASRAIASEVRPFDRVFRIGGEEFAAILGGVDSKDARTAAERLRASVAAHPVAIEGKAIHTTVSVGVAMGEPTNDPSTLLHAADAALYRAKAEGRNRVVVSGEGGD
jgi:diguanylate cyclase (GGDEF)-like protein